MLDIERQETDKVMSNTIDGEEYTRGKRDYDYLNLNIYNVNNPMQIKRINILELISTIVRDSKILFFIMLVCKMMVHFM